MFDDEFEQTKDYLKTKLGDYLRNKGINPAVQFRCLNPEHQDMHPSMAYNMHNHTVHCFSCNATYDIFDLVGIDCQLPSFRDQLARLREMFLSHTMTRGRNFDKPGSVTFGISNDNSLQHATPLERPQLVSVRDAGRFIENSPQSLQSINDEKIMPHSPGFGTMLSTAPGLQRAQGVRFGQDSGVISDQNQNREASLAEKKISYAAYLKQCRSQITLNDYFQRRGISREIIEKFGLGYDDKFEAAYDHGGGEGVIWKAVIIPYNDFAYMACNTDLYAKDRIVRRGRAEIFNAAALSRPGAVFITEDEFDALSLETLGWSALAVCGTSCIRVLLEKIQESSSQSRMFYLCSGGRENSLGITQQLSESLKQLQQPCKRVNLAFPFRDLNTALIKDRQGLLYRLQNLEQLLACTLQPVFAAREESYITSAEQLLAMSVSPSLYAICGQPLLIRLLCVRLMRQMRGQLTYAASAAQWQLLCNCLYTFAPEQLPYNTLIHAHLLEIRDSFCLSDVSAALETAIAAYRLQNESSCVLMADLLAIPEALVAQYAALLGRLCQSYQQPAIILAHEKFQDLLEGCCMQVLTLSHDAQNFNFTTCSNNGQDLEFSMAITPRILPPA